MALTAIKEDPNLQIYSRKQKLEEITSTFRENYSTLMRIAKRYLKPQDAEDLLQDTFEHALIYIDRYQPEGHPLAWLKKIMFNVYLSQYTKKCRRERIYQRQTMRDFIADPKDTYEKSDEQLSNQVTEALAGLRDRYRQVLLTCDYEDYTKEEAAQLLGIPLGTVSSTLHRARISMMERLARYAWVAYQLKRKARRQWKSQNHRRSKST